MPKNLTRKTIFFLGGAGLFLVVIPATYVFVFPTTTTSTHVCGDFLSLYAEKPVHLEFIDCHYDDGLQEQVVAQYRVSGQHSQAVEDFLVENYQMGPLEWFCCGWETPGQYGSFTHPALAQSNISAAVVMYGSGVLEDDQNGAQLEYDRADVPYFYVDVSLGVI